MNINPKNIILINQFYYLHKEFYVQDYAEKFIDWQRFSH